MQVKFYFNCSILIKWTFQLSNEQQSGQTRVAAAETLVKEHVVFMQGIGK
jgi:hypothetical protein